MQNTFNLQPFPSSFASAHLEITGNIARTENLLTISYNLLDNIQQVDIATPETPQRKHELWQNTCFEFFLIVKIPKKN